MLRALACCTGLLLATGAVRAEEPAKQGDQLHPGMSIVGNDEAPKALVIVPWKSSGLGDPLAVSRILDDGRQPVDRDVFERELHYYEIWAASQGPRRPASP
jgi:hypothetical protein